jgi:hypothetical protein
LRYFLPVAEDAEFRSTREDLTPPQQAALPASAGDAVVAQDRFNVPTPRFAGFVEWAV